MIFNSMMQEHEKILFEASQNIKQEKKYQDKVKNKNNLLNEITTQFQKRDMGREFYDPYDSIVCEGKLKIDMLYYQQLMENLDDNYNSIVENVLVDLLKTVKNIYEFVNIKPEIFGSGITEELLNESSVEINRKLSKHIYESLDATFYKLTPQERSAKYKDISEQYIKELITEGAEADTAITFAIKTAVMENLLTKVSFPFTCWTRVKYLTESHDYGLVFDQQHLIELVESFEHKIKKLSKIIATCV